MTHLDYHVHTTYSDGGDLRVTARAAERIGLDGIGFADHCNVTDPDLSAHPAYRLHETYEDRRAAIDACRGDLDLAIFDAVELDYEPDGEPEIRAFLDEAGFDYALGSVHTIDGVNVLSGQAVPEMDEDRKRAFVDQYFETVVDLVESEIFDVAAHLDVLERHPDLRGVPTERHYRSVAGAFEDSRTVPEINFGSVTSDLGRTHPRAEFVEILQDRGVPFVFGSDAHSPGQLEARHGYYRADDRFPEFDEIDFHHDS